MSQTTRGYDEVAVRPAEHNQWHILLDGKPVTTPQGHTLSVPSQLLAEAVANEWRAQGAPIDPNTMPRTRLLTIAADRVAEDRAALVKEVTGYAETDLLCYRAEESELALKQVVHFDPILDWALEIHGIVFAVTDTTLTVTQPDKSLQKVRHMVESCDDLALAAMAMATPILGSALLALALKERHISPEFAWQSARLEETLAAERYGKDPETEAIWAEKLRDIQACSAVFAAV
jgi:chaperone required for assembly of F1-ATPase